MNNEKLKSFFSFILFFIIFILFIQLGIIIHEFGHLLACYLFKIKILSININFLQTSYITIRKPKDVNSYRLLLIFGSLIAILFGFFLILLSFYTKKNIFILSGLNIIAHNLIYWSLINEKTSDCYKFIHTFNHYNYFLHFFIIILITILAFSSIYFYRNYKFESKYYF